MQQQLHPFDEKQQKLIRERVKGDGSFRLAMRMLMMRSPVTRIKFEFIVLFPAPRKSVTVVNRYFTASVKIRSCQKVMYELLCCSYQQQQL
jgi:hypothetical protein